MKSAFLNSVLEKEVFVEQIPGYEKKDKEDKVYRLKNALYGLKHLGHEVKIINEIYYIQQINT